MTKTFTVRIFPDDETTEVVYETVTHVFWEAGNTVLTLCLPDRHAHWLRERIRHYDVNEGKLDVPPFCDIVYDIVINSKPINIKPWKWN